MRTLTTLAAAVVLAASLSTSAIAQSEDWHTLQQNSISQYAGTSNRDGTWKLRSFYMHDWYQPNNTLLQNNQRAAKEHYGRRWPAFISSTGAPSFFKSARNFEEHSKAAVQNSSYNFDGGGITPSNCSNCSGTATSGGGSFMNELK